MRIIIQDNDGQPKTVADGWHQYMNTCYPMKLEPDHEGQLRQAYYGGAWAVIFLLKMLLASKPSRKKMIKTIEALHQEVLADRNKEKQ